MTKLIKNLIIGGSTTAAVAGGATGAGVALTKKHSEVKPVAANNQSAVSNEIAAQEAAKIAAANRAHTIEMSYQAHKLFLTEAHRADKAVQDAEWAKGWSDLLASQIAHGQELQSSASNIYDDKLTSNFEQAKSDAEHAGIKTEEDANALKNSTEYQAFLAQLSGQTA